MNRDFGTIAITLLIAGCETASTGNGGVGGTGGGAGGEGGNGGSAPERPVALANLITRNPDPLERVAFDGSQSYSDITDFLWEVIEMPVSADPADFQPEGQGTATYSFIPPLIGYYLVRLTVTNAADLTSLDTPDAKVGFEALGFDRLHVQLVWSDDASDQDIHLVNVDLDERLCSASGDCYNGNRTPTWFSEPEDADANPTLDLDDSDGMGPENINVDDPLPGAYRVFAHYANANGATDTELTARLYVDALLAAEYTRTLSAEDTVWAVADVTVADDFTISIDAYPTDGGGDGAVATINQTCTPPGWAFP